MVTTSTRVGPRAGTARRVTYTATKRAIDILAAVVLLVVSLPLWIIVAIAVRIDSHGRALFWQERVGMGGEHFRILKFRSMEAGADEGVHRRHHVQLANGSGGSRPIRLEDDPRVTRTGRIIRRWSLDELPNLWNVLVGDMSLVGPRPLVPYEVELLDAEALRRFEVKPGITGLAQVNGRLDITADGRANLDVTYVDERSVWLDVKILLRTLPALVRNRGA